MELKGYTVVGGTEDGRILWEELRGEHLGWCQETSPTVLRVAKWPGCGPAELGGLAHQCLYGTSAGTWPLAEKQQMLAECKGEKAVMSPREFTAGTES